jgi:DNA polymerase-3 subunit delta
MRIGFVCLTARRARRTLRSVSPVAVKSKSIYLIAGDDEFSIKEAAGKLAGKLAPKQAGEFGLEIIDGAALNQDEALKILARLNEAINTVGFFGGEKLVWLKSTNLLSDEPVTRSEAVKEALGELADRLKRGLPDDVTLLISAIGCDRRKSLYKLMEKQAEVRFFAAPDEGKDAGDEEIASFIQQKTRQEGKTMLPEAFEAFRKMVAPDLREMAGELEKLFLYVGKRPQITVADVRAICSTSRTAEIWDLTDALGARNLPAATAALENLLASGEAPIGIVMLLAGQFRLMLLARDLMERNLVSVRDGAGAGFEFVKAFERLPENYTTHFPRTKAGALPNAWRLHRCALAAKNFSVDELVRAMDLLLRANLQLVSTQLDARLVLEEALAKIARKSD